jgi:adenine C2-methylase RlmN of 23S rRNA A2503 and tRNA A37
VTISPCGTIKRHEFRNLPGAVPSPFFRPVDLIPFERHQPADIARFAKILTDAGVPAAVRYRQGFETKARSGQMRVSSPTVFSQTGRRPYRSAETQFN